MRKIEPLERLAGDSEWEVAGHFLARRLWPYFVRDAPGARFEPHYHRTDEELQVMEGVMTFFVLGPAAGPGIELEAGQRARIPEGTVHRVEIGPEGVSYVMGLGSASSLEDFPVYLPAGADASADVLAALVELNYAMAEAEETGEAARPLFESELSERFVFIGAFGNRSMNKTEFVGGLEGRKDKGRRSTGLRIRKEGSALAASLLVATRDGGEYVNTRLFEKEADQRWRCVRWSNAQARAAR